MNRNKWWLFLIATFITTNISSSSSDSDIGKLQSGTINNSSNYSSSWFLETTSEALQKARKVYEAIMTSEPGFHWVSQRDNGTMNIYDRAHSIKKYGLLTPKDSFEKQSFKTSIAEKKQNHRYNNVFLFPDAESAVRYCCFLGVNPNSHPLVIALIPENPNVYSAGMSKDMDSNRDKEQIKLPKKEWKKIEDKYKKTFTERKNKFFVQFNELPLFEKTGDTEEELTRAMKDYVAFPEVRSVKSYTPEEIHVEIGEEKNNFPVGSPEYEQEIQRNIAATYREENEIIKKITPSDETVKRLRRATIKRELLKGYNAISKNMPSLKK